MAHVADSRFAALVSALESLDSAYVNAVDDSQRNTIKSRFDELIKEMTPEQIECYRLYIEERAQQAESNLKSCRNVLTELENESERRRAR